MQANTTMFYNTGGHRDVYRNKEAIVGKSSAELSPWLAALGEVPT
jgi:hypothetical protein